MVDVRRLKMLQMVQLFKCEEDALQVEQTTKTHAAILSDRSDSNLCLFYVCMHKAVEWLGELLDALLKTHVRLGDDAQETRGMLDKHRKFVDVAQVRHFLITQPQPNQGALSIKKTQNVEKKHFKW